MYSLSFSDKHRPGYLNERGSGKTERHFKDFLISGKSLLQILNEEHADFIGTFGWMTNKEYERGLLHVFLGRTSPELSTGRTALYVCPECGDIGCGAITAEIIFTNHTVIWKNFGYENDYEDVNFSRYANIGPIEFQRSQYEETLNQLQKELHL